MPRIERKPRAEQDLLDIWQGIADVSRDYDTADNFFERIEQKIITLAHQPKIGRPRPEINPKARSFVVGRYIILYVPQEDGITVVRVVYGGRDMQNVEFDDE